MRMAGTVAAAVGIAAMFAVPASGATFDSAAEVANALRDSPVAVDSRARPPVTTAEQLSVIAEIRRLDPGRIRIAYVRKELATQAGTVKALTNAISDGLSVDGVVLVEAGEDVYLVTSYLDTDAALEAVRGAFGRTEKTETPGRQLLEVARALATVDPGPEAQKGHEDVTTVNAGGIVRAVEIFFFSLVGLVVVIAAVIVVPRAVRARRRHEDLDEALSDRRAAAKEALLALGGAIEELDIDTQMPNADAEGKSHYSAAVDAYTKGEEQLQKADSEGRLAAAEQTIAAGRAEMDRARARLRRS